jgi:hypothetical protein
VSIRVDGRESPGDVPHNGCEELLKGACGLDPQLERKREEGMILRWGRELFGPEYNGSGLAMSKASKLLKALTDCGTMLPWFSPHDAGSVA